MYNQPYGDPRRIYREHQVSVLGTGRLTLLVLETALGACRRRQRGLLTRALRELAKGLDLGTGEIAVQLLGLYRYMLREVREGRMAGIEGMLGDLRDTWEIALRREGAREGSPAAPGSASLSAPAE